MEKIITNNKKKLLMCCFSAGNLPQKNICNCELIFNHLIILENLKITQLLSFLWINLHKLKHNMDTKQSFHFKGITFFCILFSKWCIAALKILASLVFQFHLVYLIVLFTYVKYQMCVLCCVKVSLSDTLSLAFFF